MNSIRGAYSRAKGPACPFLASHASHSTDKEDKLKKSGTHLPADAGRAIALRFFRLDLQPELGLFCRPGHPASRRTRAEASPPGSSHPRRMLRRGPFGCGSD